MGTKRFQPSALLEAALASNYSKSPCRSSDDISLAELYIADECFRERPSRRVECRQVRSVVLTNS
jgi:hypothetical protein